MAFSIGRITLPSEPLNWRNSGTTVTVTGSYTGASVNAGIILRSQLLGYVQNLDEPIVPVLSSADSVMNGFYRVTSVDIPTDPVALLNGHFDYAIGLEPIAAYQAPYVECFLTGALMVNALGVTTAAEPFHAFPRAFEYGNGVAGYTTETRGTADATPFSITWVRMNPAGNAPTYKTLARYGVVATDFLQAACTITNALPASHTVVGRQDCPQTSQWTLSNGLVSVSLSSSTFTAQWADPTYRTTTLFSISGATMGGVFGAIGASGAMVRILRNAPEECIIRVPCTPFTGLVGTPAYLDVSIRRGSRIVRFYLIASISDTWTLAYTTPVASTAITGGNRWTANDANGNRVAIFSAKASTNDLVNGKITANAAGTTFDCGIAMELAGSASVNRDTALSQVMQYLAAQAERVQVAGR